MNKRRCISNPIAEKAGFLTRWHPNTPQCDAYMILKLARGNAHRVRLSALTFLLEAIGFWIAYSAPVMRVLVADFGFQAGIRPGWYVWGIGLIVIMIGLIRMKPAGGRLQLATSTPG